MEAKQKAAPNFIRVGHPAYSGANASQWTNSKNKAIAILRDRGVKRDCARRAVARAMAGEHVGVRGGLYGTESIEIVVFDDCYIAQAGMLPAEEACAAITKAGA